MSASLVHHFSVALSSHDGTCFECDAVCSIVDGEVTIESATFEGEPVDPSPEETEFIKTAAILQL